MYIIYIGKGTTKLNHTYTYVKSQERYCGTTLIVDVALQIIKDSKDRFVHGAQSIHASHTRGITDYVWSV